jgi:hypothetical protein
MDNKGPASAGLLCPQPLKGGIHAQGLPNE